MGFTCKDAGDYLDGPVCRRIARDETGSVTWIDADDVLQDARANLFRYRLAKSCPALADCPLNLGRSRTPCDLGMPPGGAKAFLKTTVYNAAVDRREARSGEKPGEHAEQMADRRGSLTGPQPQAFDGLDQVELRALAPKLLEQFQAMLQRVTEGESPKWVFPGIGQTRHDLKLQAAALLLRLKTEGVDAALRSLDPDRYADTASTTPPDSPTTVSPESSGASSRRRLERDRDGVRAVLQAVWRAAMATEA